MGAKPSLLKIHENVFRHKRHQVITHNGENYIPGSFRILFTSANIVKVQVAVSLLASGHTGSYIFNIGTS